MIPVRLQLKNFMSYGEGVPPLEFSGMRLACLSGDNGNGKTALLDAMTWALWGETRAPSEEDVIRLGATECRVLFDFLVDGQKYRIHKARGRRAAGAVWELQAWQEDGTLRSLSGTSSRDTKEKIRQLLRMDYRTFLASAYLAQGRADEFSRSTPARRKEVLADILDLSRYERLEGLAKEKRMEADARLLDEERTIATIDRELEREDEHFLALKEAENLFAQLAAELDRLQTEHAGLSASFERLSQKEEQARDYENRIREVEAEIAHERETLRTAEERAALAAQIIARAAEIEAAYENLQTLQARIGPLEKQYDTVIALQREAGNLEKTIGEEQGALANEAYRVRCEAQDVEREGADVARLDAEVARLDQEIAGFGEPEARYRSVEEQRARADEAFVDLRASHDAFKPQIERLQTRVQALAGSDEPLCDYCGQPLSADGRAQATTDAQAEIAGLKTEMKRVAAEGVEAKNRREHLKTEADRALADAQTVLRLDARRAQATQERVRLRERVQTLPALQERLARLEKKIADRDFAHDAQERLMAISARLERSERVAQELRAARTEQQRLANAPEELARLRSAQTTWDEAARQADAARATITRRESQIAKADVAIARIRQETAALPELTQNLARVGTDLAAVGLQAQTTQREIGNRASQLERIAGLKQERGRRAQAMQAAARDKQIYSELQAAFGKKGVQALIIENALPEIQDSANDTLGRMTDGGMQVQLVTQKEAKTRGVATIETLDIIISDEMGTRPYEMFSGGEAFRINFALRIALSKMLARRAGARLQTIFLDEGFGTQDPRGRESIVDAINAITDEFALILVITHIEELKDQFPTRIEVVKGTGGSTFTVA